MKELEDLIKSIESAKTKPRQAPKRHAPQRQAPRKSLGRYIQKSGDGGMIMAFGSHTGNRSVDQMNQLLSQNVDKTQQEIANHQHNEFQKALGDFVEMGEGNYSQNVQIQEAKQVTVNAEAHANIQKAYEKTAMNVGGERVVAQSETDQAVLEMLNSEGADID